MKSCCFFTFIILMLRKTTNGGKNKGQSPNPCVKLGLDQNNIWVIRLQVVILKWENTFVMAMKNKVCDGNKKQQRKNMEKIKYQEK